MAGHMGAERVNISHLRVLESNPARGLLLVEGSVPGARQGLLHIRHSKKTIVEVRARRAAKPSRRDEEEPESAQEEAPRDEKPPTAQEEQATPEEPETAQDEQPTSEEPEASVEEQAPSGGDVENEQA